jgi:hypothetical protein
MPGFGFGCLVTDREKIELAAKTAADLIADAALLEAVCCFQAGKDLLGGGFPILEAGLGQGVAHLLVDLVNRPLVYGRRNDTGIFQDTVEIKLGCD